VGANYCVQPLASVELPNHIDQERPFPLSSALPFIFHPPSLRVWFASPPPITSVKFTTLAVLHIHSPSSEGLADSEL